MNWLPTNLEPVPSYLHAGGANIRKGNNPTAVSGMAKNNISNAFDFWTHYNVTRI